MSRKNNLKPFKVLTAGDMSGSPISKVTNLIHLDNVAVQANWTGASPVGVIQVQVSNDYNQDELGNVLNAGNWVPVVLSPIPSIAANSGSIFIDLNQLASQWVRVQYVRTSGTGSMDLWLSAKMI